MTGTRPLLTVGHGPHGRAALGELLTGAGVASLVDVRRFPGSRRNPDVAREALAEWLPTVGVTYRWCEPLGGRRRLDPDVPPRDVWWRVAQFQAYAAYTRTAPFRTALAAVVEESRRHTVAVMCAESLWWRCHRRLIADVVVLGHGLPVRHVMPTGELRDHPPAAGARALPDGSVVWDAEPA
ncbi:uncharacterized protein DUF488 [Stackebrandtia albiflava]|uniref:Uncharacterized protein DUF488 n=1 Tax=Stackebrandtia albiflava TaxID=406432 RepID=A0A562V244_9ACTN|nr:DUF488 domain-containing protein [Stackebrandtia albiflava]TWJ11948.1 uncharacterized protein DUF488 [Stackebrandtia albiflava]